MYIKTKNYNKVHFTTWLVPWTVRNTSPWFTSDLCLTSLLFRSAVQPHTIKCRFNGIPVGDCGYHCNQNCTGTSTGILRLIFETPTSMTRCDCSSERVTLLLSFNSSLSIFVSLSIFPFLHISQSFFLHRYFVFHINI